MDQIGDVLMYAPDPPENCNLTVKICQKLDILSKKLPKVVIFSTKLPLKENDNFCQFFLKKCQVFDIQMGIFRRVRLELYVLTSISSISKKVSKYERRLKLLLIYQSTHCVRLAG